MYISYGTAKSGVGISAMSVLRPDLMMKCVVPVIMAGIIAVRHYLPKNTVYSYINRFMASSFRYSLLVTVRNSFNLSFHLLTDLLFLRLSPHTGNNLLCHVSCNP